MLDYLDYFFPFEFLNRVRFRGLVFFCYEHWVPFPDPAFLVNFRCWYVSHTAKLADKPAAFFLLEKSFEVATLKS